MNLTIPADDHGTIRVFSITGALPAGLFDKSPDALRAVFGTDGLNADFVDVVDIAALDDMSLHDLLVHGYDMTPDPIDAAALAAITDTAILVMSRATGGAETAMTLRDGVTHVTTCGDGAQLHVATPMPTESAKGIIDAPQPTPKSDAAIGGRVAIFALIMMFAVFGMMVWIGG